MRTLLLVTLLAMTSRAQTLTLGGAILGKVQGEDGTVLAAAKIFISRDPSISAGSAAGTANAPSPSPNQLSRPDGTFGFTGLHPGVYRLCASFSGTVWLSSCEWGGPPPKVTVGSEQVVDKIVLTLKKGQPLSIQLNDPGNLVTANQKTTPGAHVLLGVKTDSGGFHPANPVSSSALGQKYSVLVPTGSTVNVIFYSATFKLQDQLGKPVPQAGTTISVTTAAGQSPSPLVLAVTGVVKPAVVPSP